MFNNGSIKKQITAHFIFFAVLGILLDTVSASLLNVYQVNRANTERLEQSLVVLQREIAAKLPLTGESLDKFLDNQKSIEGLIIALRSRDIAKIEEDFVFSPDNMAYLFSLAQNLSVASWGLYVPDAAQPMGFRLGAEFSGAKRELWTNNGKVMKYGSSGYMDVESAADRSIFPEDLGQPLSDLEWSMGQLFINMQFDLSIIEDRLVLKHLSNYPVVGRLFVKKPVSLDLAQWEPALGVNLTLFSARGEQVYGSVEFPAFAPSILREATILPRLIDRNHEAHMGQFRTIAYDGVTYGYILASISSVSTTLAVWRTIGLLASIGLIILSLIIYISRELIRKMTDPILELERASRQMEAGNLEYNIDITRNDELGHLAIRFSRMRDAIKEKMLSLAAEITERKRTEEKLADYSLRLEELVDQRTRELETQRAKTAQSEKMASLGTMASGVAHEINSPLATIRLRASQIRTVIARGMDINKAAEFAGVIEATADRITEIVQGLRSFARDDSVDQMDAYSVKKIIDETLVLCGERFKNHNVKLLVSNSGDGLRALCRPVQISQIILNLLNNAFDALQGYQDPTITMNVYAEQDKVIISVADNGPGVSPDKREKIFEPFFTTKEIGKGTGLGLSISMGLAQSNKGTLHLSANLEQTCFVLSLQKADEQGQVA